MSKPLSRPLHGLLGDYPYVAVMSTAPETLGFKDEPTATTLCRVMAAALLGVSLMTRAEWGLFRVLPYKLHLTRDVLAGALAMGAPWLFGFAHNSRARNTFLALGATSIVVAELLSQPEEMPERGGV